MPLHPQSVTLMVEFRPHGEGRGNVFEPGVSPVLQFDLERLLWEGLAVSQRTDAERPPTEMLTRRKPQTGLAQGSSMHRQGDLSVCLLPAPCLSGEAGPDSLLEAAECPSSASLRPPPLHLQPISPPAAGLLEGVCVWAGRVDRLSPSWACRAETPASSSRLPGPGPALHTCPLSCPRGLALLRPSGGTGGAPTLSGPLSLHQQDEGVPSVAAVGGGGAGGGNLTLAETSMRHMFSARYT